MYHMSIGYSDTLVERYDVRLVLSSVRTQSGAVSLFVSVIIAYMQLILAQSSCPTIVQERA